MMTVASFIYGLLTILGGLMGYLKAGSKKSLYSGILFGVLIILAAWAMVANELAGYYGLIVLSLMLAIVFTIRFIKTKAFMPAGLMLMLSLLMIIGLSLTK